eukprot:5459369-Pyramimonas_sp.AAC.1
MGQLWGQILLLRNCTSKMIVGVDDPTSRRSATGNAGVGSWPSPLQDCAAVRAFDGAPSPRMRPRCWLTCFPTFAALSISRNQPIKCDVNAVALLGSAITRCP